MSTSVVGLNDFISLFTGNTSAHGQHVYATKTTKGKKAAGKSTTQRKPLTEELYEKHLNGKLGLGVIPITRDSLCHFCAIDIDIYTTPLKHIVDTIYQYDLPLAPIRTKSGGLHLYMFFTEPIKAAKAISYMRFYSGLLSLAKGTEIFPKQEKLGAKQVGNWINLPYYNSDNPNQYLYDEDMQPVPFDEAMQILKKKRKTVAELDASFDELPIADGPPCLQAIYMSGDTEYRNNYLFSLARYYKAKYPDDWQAKIIAGNQALNKPMDHNELQNSVIASHEKKDYSYKCNDEPIVSICQKGVCKTRRFGIGGAEVSGLSFGPMTQHKAEPPFYIWEINNVELTFFSEQDLIKQDRFRQQCLRELHILPYQLKNENWNDIINHAFSNIKIVEEDIKNGMSTGATFHNILFEFFEKRVHAENKLQLTLGRVYKDEDRQAYVFKSAELIEFIVNQKRFREFGRTEIQRKLRAMGADTLNYNIPEHPARYIRAWSLPFTAFEETIKNDPEQDVDVSFMEGYEEEPY